MYLCNNSSRVFVGQVMLVVSMCIYFLIYLSQSFRADKSFPSKIFEVYKHVNAHRQVNSESDKILLQNSTDGKLSGSRKLELCDGDSAYHDSAELQQLYNFWKNPRDTRKTHRVGSNDIRNTHELLEQNPMKELANITNVSQTGHTSLKWDILPSLEIHESCSILHLNVTEVLHNKISQGGSSFELIIENYVHDLSAMCSVVDMFNGTYDFRCPCIPNEVLKSSIGFLLFDFANFEAYWRRWKPWSRAIWTDYFENIGIYQGQTDATGSCLGYWQRINNILTWVQSGSPIPRLGRSEISTCLDRYQKITFVGDSHIRYTYDYWKNVRGVIGNTDHVHANTEFIESHYANDVYHSLLEFERKIRKTTTKQLLIVSGLHWDLMNLVNGRDQFYSYFKRMEQVVDVLRRLSSVPNLTVVWFTSPAKPNGINERANNFILRAANTWAKIQMHEAGIQVFDVFSPTFSKHEGNVCGVHYLCSIKEKAKGRLTKTYGTVGISVAETFFTKLCST